MLCIGIGQGPPKMASETTNDQSCKVIRRSIINKNPISVFLGNWLPFLEMKFLNKTPILEDNVVQATGMQEMLIKVGKDNVVRLLEHETASIINGNHILRSDRGNTNTRRIREHGEITSL